MIQSVHIEHERNILAELYLLHELVKRNKLVYLDRHKSEPLTLGLGSRSFSAVSLRVPTVACHRDALVLLLLLLLFVCVAVPIMERMEEL